jgi:hypothetical protein
MASRHAATGVRLATKGLWRTLRSGRIIGSSQLSSRPEGIVQTHLSIQSAIAAQQIDDRIRVADGTRLARDARRARRSDVGALRRPRRSDVVVGAPPTVRLGR